MSLEIEIDPHGIERTPFNDLRERLLAEDRRFAEADLARLPYHQIRLAALANAGASACTLTEVQAEKERRRYRFLTMSPDTLQSASRYLASEGMLGEINAILEMRQAPRLKYQTPRTQLWLKLNCLHNHLDRPHARMDEARQLLNAAYDANSLDCEMGLRFRQELDHMMLYYPHGLRIDQLRHRIGAMAEELLETLSDTEWDVCSRNLIADYSCTSDCYRPI